MRFLFIVVMAIFLTFFISNVDKNTHKEIKKFKKSNEIIHTVKKGETLTKISFKYAAYKKDIKKVNNLKTNSVYQGQKLVIPIPKLKGYKGVASWYGEKESGEKRADGENFNENEILVAHRKWPLGTKVLIINLKNGRKSEAVIKDRGPYTKKLGFYTRDVDCSLGLAKKLGFVEDGLTPVKIIPLQKYG